MKKILCVLMMAVMALSLVACTDEPSGDASSSPTSSGPNGSTAPGELSHEYAAFINGSDAVIPLTAPDQCLYHRERLVTEDKDLTWAYDEVAYVASHLANPNEEFDTMCNVYFSQGISQADLDTVYVAVTCDHPELWFLRQYDKNGCKLDASSDQLAYLSFNHTLEEIVELDKKLQKAADKLTAQVETFAADMDKIAFLSGYLYDNCSIDWPSYNETQHSSAMELLVENHGVCVGYASTTVFLLQRWGIASIMGHGVVSSGVSHCWAIIEKDGVYNYVDNYFMKDKGSGIERSLANFFCFTDRAVLDNEHVTIDVGVLLPGTPVGGGQVVTEDTYPTEEPTATPEATVPPETAGTPTP